MCYISSQQCNFPYPKQNKVTRAFCHIGGYVLKKIDDKNTLVIYISDVDLAGSIPGMVKNQLAQKQASLPAFIEKNLKWSNINNLHKNYYLPCMNIWNKFTSICIYYLILFHFQKDVKRRLNSCSPTCRGFLWFSPRSTPNRWNSTTIASLKSSQLHPIIKKSPKLIIFLIPGILHSISKIP